MSNPWMAVDDLINELGSIRRVAPQVWADARVKAAVDRAIAEAAEAVDFTLNGPTNPGRLLAARDALGVAEEILILLNADFAKGLRARNRSGLLRARAAALIETARALPAKSG